MVPFSPALSLVCHVEWCSPDLLVLECQHEFIDCTSQDIKLFISFSDESTSHPCSNNLSTLEIRYVILIHLNINIFSKKKKPPKTVDEYECVCMCMIWILSAFAILIHSVVYVRNNKIKNKDICQQMLHSTFAYIYAKGKLILILKNIQFNIHNIFCTKLTAASFKKFAQCL